MKLGIYQCLAGALPPEQRLSQIETQLKAAPLDLLICPELFASGYLPGPEMTSRAEAQNGPFGQSVARLAEQYGTAIAYGYPELAGNVIYNSAALYDANGALIANHRKRLPSPGSFEVLAFGTGDHVTFADLAGWRVAMIICYEVEFPESLRTAAEGGAELVIVPTALSADWGIVSEKLVPTRAFENGVWIAYADQAGTADGLSFYGGSRIVGPDGSDHAVAGDAEERISARIDKDSVERMQARLPYLRDYKKL